MSENMIREPIQKRSIEKKEKIIKAGFDIICKKGYYNTNTAEIAKEAGVSTGIVYNYFKDKHDILLEGMKLYSDDILFPVINFFKDTNIEFDNMEDHIHSIVEEFINNHKLSKIAHEEITAMIHSDEEIGEIYHEHEFEVTKKITNIMIKKGVDSKNLLEKVHISIGLIDDLCHEIVFHKHTDINYDIMIEIVTKSIINLINM